MDDLFVVLQPGNHMFHVIQAAHRQGYTVVVFHTGPVSPPMPYAEALPCISHYIRLDSWRDAQAAFLSIIEWCGQCRVRGTYAGYEITLRVEVLLRSHYGLPGMDPKRLDLLLDKTRVRVLLQQRSLTHLRFVEEKQLRQLSEWPFPGRSAFLKPVNGSGSAYVRQCHSLAEVHEHLAEWDHDARHVASHVADYLHRGLGLFLEEAAVGELLSVEGYSFCGAYTPIGILDRTVLARDVAVEMGETFPCPHPRAKEILEKVKAIHECLGIEHGATHTELIVPVPDGDIELVELNLRFVGGDVLILVNHAFDVHFEDALLTLSMGEAPQVALPAQPVRYTCGQDFLAPADVRQFENIEIPGEDVFFRKITAKPGTVLKSTNFQADQVASFVVAADSYRGALARAQEIRMATRLNGRLLGNDPNNVVINYADRWK